MVKLSDTNKKRFSFLRRGGNTNESIVKNTSIMINPPFGVNQKQKSNSTVLGSHEENTDSIDEFIESPEIQRLRLIMLDRTPQNIRWAFNHDNACKTASFILAQAVIGATGLTAKTDDEELKNDINEYLDKIDVNGIIQQSLKDNICFTESVYWKVYDKELGLILPKWVDFVTLTPITNKFTGEKKWVQYTYIDSQMPVNDKKGWKTYEPMLDYSHLTNWISEPKDQPIKKHIFPDDVVNFQFFKSPPILGVVDIILWKKWMQYDAKLGGQKYATPLIDASVSLPETYDVTSDETQELMDRIADDLNKLMAFGVLAHPESIKLQTINQTGQVFDYVRYLEYADKQIHKAIFLPNNLLDSAGSELATSRTTKDMFIIVVNALRRKYTRIFKTLILENFEFIGRDIDKRNFELVFSEEDSQQQFTHNEEFTAIMQMFDRGILKDANEVRAYVKKLGIELPQLTDDDLELKQEEEFNNMLMQAGGDLGGNPNEQDYGDIEQDIKKGVKE